MLTRTRWAPILALGVQAALVVGVPGLLFQAIQATTDYRVETIDWWLYGASCLCLIVLSIWFFTRARTRARFAKRPPPRREA